MVDDHVKVMREPTSASLVLADSDTVIGVTGSVTGSLEPPPPPPHATRVISRMIKYP